MKSRIVLFALVFALGCLLVAQTPGQDEETVRGAFLTTRPKEKPAQPSAGAKPIHRRPRPVATPTPTVSGSNSKNSNSSAPEPGTAKVVNQRIGLGLTLFTRDSNGLAVRVDPSHEFRKGEAVRILLETNSDGYLYIFNTTDNGAPVMIYPSAELDEGGNYLQSHVPFEIPSSLASEERVRWFRFDENAGTERLYFIFTREALAGVPIEDNLISYCRESKPCQWHPSAELWTQLRKQMSAPLKTSKNEKYGRPQTASEQVATTRGLGLSQEDPAPSLIVMAVGTGSNSLVTTLDLIHK